MNNITKNALLAPFNLLYKVSPKLTLLILFRVKLGYSLNLKNPRTYNEKLQWIKLYDRNPLMPKCCDKYAVREYVKSKGFGFILNELIWQGFDPAEIPFDDLPDRFVVKVTHGSTFNIICTDKSKLDRAEVVRKCRTWLNAKFLPCYGEWFYGVERPRIIVEEYLEGDDGSALRDYKVFCFNGIPRLVSVYSNREEDCRQDIYDTGWDLLDDLVGSYPQSGEKLPKPACLEQILSAASRLSEDFTHARVDFFIVGGEPVFGEITFTSGAGFSRFGTFKLDQQMGDWLKLPERGAWVA